METYEYHQILKYLYFEGYADSYQEAEELVEELTDEEFEFLYEDVFGIDESSLSGSLARLALKGTKSAVKAVRDYGSNYPIGTNRRAVSDAIDRIRWASLSDEEKTKRTNAKHRKRNTKKGHDEIVARNLRSREIRDKIGPRENYEYLISYLIDEGYVERPVEKIKSKALKVVNKSNPTVDDVALHHHLWKYATRRKSGPYGSERAKAKSKKNIDKSYDNDNDDNNYNDSYEVRENYEYLISYLIDEGYAEDLDSASVIYENMSEGWKTDVLKSTLKGTGKVLKYGAKKLNQSKFGKRAKKFVTRTALGAVGIPMIS